MMFQSGRNQVIELPFRLRQRFCRNGQSHRFTLRSGPDGRRVGFVARCSAAPKEAAADQFTHHPMTEVVLKGQN